MHQPHVNRFTLMDKPHNVYAHCSSSSPTCQMRILRRHPLALASTFLPAPYAVSMLCQCCVNAVWIGFVSVDIVFCETSQLETATEQLVELSHSHESLHRNQHNDDPVMVGAHRWERHDEVSFVERFCGKSTSTFLMTRPYCSLQTAR